MASTNDIRISLLLDAKGQRLLDSLKTVDVKLSLTGRDYLKLKDWATDGITIKTRIQLIGSDYNRLIGWINNGITIPVRFNGPANPSGGGGNRGSSSGSGPLDFNKAAFNLLGINNLNPQALTGNQIQQINDFIRGFGLTAPRGRTDKVNLVKNLANNTARQLEAEAQQAADLTRAAAADQANQNRLNVVNFNAEKVRRQQQAQQDRADQQSANRAFRTNQSAQKFGANEQRFLSQFRDQNELETFLAQVAPNAFGGFFPKTLQSRLSQQAPFASKNSSINQLGKVDLFDPSRLLKREALIQLGFAGLFGGPASLAGGALAGASPLGAGGVFIGSVLGQAINGFVDSIGGKIKEALDRAAEAGLTFEQSLLGISAVLQSSTRVVSTNGRDVGLGEALQFQQGQAREIQLAARAKLLPLGVAGQKEATTVQGIVAALGQRGFQFNAGQIAKIAELLVGSTQAQRPQLLDNSTLFLRDVQDLLSGGSLARRGILSQLVRPSVGGIISARNTEDIISALQDQAPFAETLRSSKNPVVVFRQYESAIDNLFTTVGDAFIQKLVPGIRSLTEALSSKDLVEAATAFAEALGAVASRLKEGLAALIEFKAPIAPNAGNLKGVTFSPIGGSLKLAGLLAGENNIGGRQTNQEDTFLNEGTFSKQEAPHAIEDFLGAGLDLFQTPIKGLTLGDIYRGLKSAGKPKAKGGLTTVQTPLAAYGNILQQFGLSSEEISKEATKVQFSPFTQLTGLGKAISLAQAAGKDTDIPGLFALKDTQIDAIKNLTIGGVDKRTFEGQQKVSELEENFAQQHQTNIQEQISYEQERISSLRDENASQDEINQHLDRLKVLELEASKYGIEITDARRQRAQNERNLAQQIAEAQAQGVVRIGFGGESRFLTAQITAKEIEAKNLREQASEIGGKQGDLLNLQADASLARRTELQEQQFTLPVKETETIQSARKSFESIGDSIKDLPNKFKELGIASERATKALKDFEEDRRLRELGSLGERIKAAKETLGAGGSFLDVPVDLQRFIDNPEELNRFQLETARERQRVTERENGTEQFNIREDQQGGLLGISQDRAQRQLANSKDRDLRDLQIQQELQAFNFLEQIKDSGIVEPEFLKARQGQARDFLLDKFGLSDKLTSAIKPTINPLTPDGTDADKGKPAGDKSQTKSDSTKVLEVLNAIKSGIDTMDSDVKKLPTQIGAQVIAGLKTQF